MTVRLLTLLALTVGLTACDKAATDTPAKADPAATTTAKTPVAKKAKTAPVAKKAITSKATAPAKKAMAATPKGAQNPALLNPALAKETAPNEFAVKLETTKGDIIIDVHRAWAPKGVDRFYNLIKIGYYDDVAFFRVIPGFMVQIGLSGDSALNKIWCMARIDDDVKKESNKPGYVTFATAGPNTRTTQFFINFGNNARLDGMGFTPFGKVRDMKIVNALYGEYGEGAPRGRGPSQGRIQAEGNKYLKAEFPKMDYIKHASILAK